MNIDEIRKNFSKASIIVSPTRLSIVYTCTDNSFVQSVDAKLLLDLFSESSLVTLERTGNSCIKLNFDMNTGADRNLIYPCSMDVLSYEEIKQLCADLDGNGKGVDAYLPDNFAELDFSDLSEGILDYIHDREKEIPDVHVDPETWQRFTDAALKLAPYMGAEFEIMEPQQKYCGSVTLYTIKSPGNSIRITGYTMKLMESLLSESTVVDIEGNSSYHSLDLTFYPA